MKQERIFQITKNHVQSCGVLLIPGMVVQDGISRQEMKLKEEPG